MKFILGLVLLAAGLMDAQRIVRPDSATILITGDFQGYLTPCGCAKPMIGGIPRLVTAVNNFRKPGRTVTLVSGGFVRDVGRQSELKAEAIAEALALLDADAAVLGHEDSALPKQVLESVRRLSGDRLLGEKPKEFIGLTVAQVPQRSTSIPDADVLLVDGEQLPVASPGSADRARLLVVRSRGSASDEPVRSGSVWTVSPGDRGKFLLVIDWSATGLTGYRAVPLGPNYADDPAAKRIMSRYLARVRTERLLERIPRQPSAKFAGSKLCGSCHGEAHEVWKLSSHASALKTLEDEQHDTDPDCVACHVVGLTAEQGFRSRKETPELTDVGCESCHGPSGDHAADPKVKTAASARESCMSCHDPDHSPNFDFERYWKRIAH